MQQNNGARKEQGKFFGFCYWCGSVESAVKSLFKVQTDISLSWYERMRLKSFTCLDVHNHM